MDQYLFFLEDSVGTIIAKSVKHAQKKLPNAHIIGKVLTETVEEILLEQRIKEIEDHAFCGGDDNIPF